MNARDRRRFVLGVVVLALFLALGLWGSTGDNLERLDEFIGDRYVEQMERESR